MEYSEEPIPLRQVRALYSDKTIRVYQAYNDTIADSALERGTLVSPPFKTERMTWIKPSFLWMMYRSGWGRKDNHQKRILALDLSREGFEWALEHSCLSHFGDGPYTTKEEWLQRKLLSPVRIQWDPERDLLLRPLKHRTIQIGLSKEAVERYVKNWISKVTDVTPLAKEVHLLVKKKNYERATSLLPNEQTYPLSPSLGTTIGV